MCLTQIDEKKYPLDLRDYEGNQYMQMPHELLGIMVRQLYKDFCRHLQGQLFRAIRKMKNVEDDLGVSLSVLLRRPTLTCKISDLLAKGEVVVTKSSGPPRRAKSSTRSTPRSASSRTWRAAQPPSTARASTPRRGDAPLRSGSWTPA